jgi:hypothetical protein
MKPPRISNIMNNTITVQYLLAIYSNIERMNVSVARSKLIFNSISIFLFQHVLRNILPLSSRQLDLQTAHRMITTSLLLNLTTRYCLLAIGLKVSFTS